MVTTPGVAEQWMTTSAVDEFGQLSKLLFQHKDRRLLQMLAEVDPSMQYDLTVAQLIKGKYKSTVLDDFLFNLYLHSVARDRKGRMEAAEMAARRAGLRGEEDLG